MFHSYEEIYRQGDALGKTLDAVCASAEEIRAFICDDQYDSIVFLACGSSYWSSLSACVTMQEQTKKPCYAIKSGDVVLNERDYNARPWHPIVIAPSRSGATSETLRAIALFQKKYGSKVFSLTEYPSSSLKSVSALNIELPWANEISVCQTRSFSCLYLAMIATAAIAGGDDALLADLSRYIDTFSDLSRSAEALVERLAQELPDWRGLVALGHGRQYGVVIEGAYINIEMAQLPAHYFGTLEWRHGPIVLANGSYLVCLTSGGDTARALEEAMAEETRAAGAKVLVIGAAQDFRSADYSASLGWDARPETAALYSVLLMQGIAYRQALLRGLDPDHPGDLQCWIKI